MKGTHVADLPAVGIATLSEALASLQCDFTEEVWDSSTLGLLAITNWSGEPLAIGQGTTMGTVKEVQLVSQDDPVWSDTSPLPGIARLEEFTEDDVSQR